jgi:hypothetical protein
MAAVQSVYAEAKECDAVDRKAEGQKQRITFGIYFYSEPASPKPPKKDE